MRNTGRTSLAAIELNSSTDEDTDAEVEVVPPQPTVSSSLPRSTKKVTRDNPKNTPAAVTTTTAKTSSSAPPPETAATPPEPEHGGATNDSVARLSLLRSRLSATAHHKFEELSPMPTITKSPYEPNQSAEVDEPLFEEMKILLMSKEELQGELQDLDGRPTLSVQAASVEIFGAALADSLVKANHVIAKSGILFSPPWLDGKECKIRGVVCGWISRPMMLLLLQEQRFARANEVVLSSLIQSIGVTKIFFDALEEWKLEKNFPKLMASAPSLSFSTKKRECYKGMIFIARAYRCTKLFRRGSTTASPKGTSPISTTAATATHSFREREPGLFAKITSCLELMNEHVKVNVKRLQEFEEAREVKRRKKALIEVATRDNIRRQQEQHHRQVMTQQQRQHRQPPADAANRRIPNHILTLNSSNGAATSAHINGGTNSNNSRRIHRQGERQESMETLLKMAENQYRLLGDTIKTLRYKIREDRRLVREEVRQEVLQEVASKNGGKKRMS